MADADFSAQGDEQLRCSSCGTPITPEDVAEGRTRQVNGKPICFSCAEALARQEAIQCKECGQTEPPLFDGRNYLCRNCGAIVRHGRHVEAKEKAAKAAGAECPYCKSPVTANARLCPACGARLIGTMRPDIPSQTRYYLVGAGVCAAIFVLAMFTMAALRKDSTGQAGNETPVATDNQLAEIRRQTDEQLAIIERRLTEMIEGNVTRLNADMENMRNKVISDVGKVLILETKPLRDRIAALEQSAGESSDFVRKPPAPEIGPPVENVEPPKPEVEPDDPLAAILNKARQKPDTPEETAPPVAPVKAAPISITVTDDQILIGQQKVTLPDLPSALAEKRGAVAPENQPLTIKARTDVNYRSLVDVLNALVAAGYTSVQMATIAETPPPANDSAGRDFIKVIRPRPDDEPEAIAKIKETVRELVDQNKFGEALAALDSRPDLRDAAWQGEREKAKQNIKRQVQELYASDLARAETYARNGQNDQARKIYEEIAGYGLPEMAAEARKRSAGLKPETPVTSSRPTRPRVTVIEEDPRISQFIEQLADKDAAQHVRTRAARELGVLKAKAAVPALIGALEDRDWYLRVCAATSLKQIGDLRAVPALIRNLDHPMIPASETALRTLMSLTGQDFGHNSAKWQQWWDTTGSAAIPPVVRNELEPPAEPPEPIELPPPTTTFESQVVILDDVNDSITINIPPDAALEEGQRITILRGADVLMTAQVALVGFGTARADIIRRTQGVEMRTGDIITVQK